MAAKRARKGLRLSAASRMCGHCVELGWEDRQNAINARALRSIQQRSIALPSDVTNVGLERCRGGLYHLR